MSGEMLTIVPGGLEDTHTFFNCGPGISIIVRRVNSGQKGNVDTKGFVRSSPSLANGLPQRFGVRLGQRREHTCGETFTSCEHLLGVNLCQETYRDLLRSKPLPPERGVRP